MAERGSGVAKQVLFGRLVLPGLARRGARYGLHHHKGTGGEMGRVRPNGQSVSERGTRGGRRSQERRLAGARGRAEARPAAGEGVHAHLEALCQRRIRADDRGAGRRGGTLCRPRRTVLFSGAIRRGLRRGGQVRAEHVPGDSRHGAAGAQHGQRALRRARGHAARFLRHHAGGRSPRGRADGFDLRIHPLPDGRVFPSRRRC